MPAVRSHRFASALAVAFSTLVALAVSAGIVAASTSYPTSIFMSEKFPAFHGRLHSNNKFCVANRPIRVFRERSGPDKFLASDRSEDDGTWQAPVGGKLVSGIYFAVAPPYGSASLGIVCGRASSKVAVVD